MNPLKQLEKYYRLAQRKKSGVADYLSLASVDGRGHPKLRTVLIKTCDHRGIGFVTNKTGPKVKQFRQHKRVAGMMAWPELTLQVRIEGVMTLMPQKEVRHFWRIRDRGAQILYSLGLKQSEEIPSFEFLKQQVRNLDLKWADLQTIPPAPNYIGFILRPTLIEFLHHSPSRMNKREWFVKTKGRWQKRILAP